MTHCPRWCCWPSSGVGTLIVTRRPGNRIGWLFCSIRLPVLLGNFATQSAVAGGAQLERGDQEPGERSLVADAEPLDGHVICGLVGGKDSEGEVLSAATLDLREERTLIQ